MNTAEIKKLATRHPEARKKFNGIYPVDLLPSVKKEGVYIVNLDDSTGDGSHWVALEIEKRKNTYFDSYGLPPKDKRLKKFLGKNYRKNLKRLQHPMTTTCGQWCLYFLLRRAQNWTVREIVKPFKKNLEKPTLINDHVLNYMVEKKFKLKKYVKVIDKEFLKDQLREQVAQQMSANLLKW